MSRSGNDPKEADQEEKGSPPVGLLNHQLSQLFFFFSRCAGWPE